jgi:hypothetical protein
MLICLHINDEKKGVWIVCYQEHHVGKFKINKKQNPKTNINSVLWYTSHTNEKKEKGTATFRAV